MKQTKYLSPKVTSIRPAQTEALALLAEFTMGNARVAMLEAPTGVGKSLVAMLAAEQMKSQFTVINTATISLQEQYAGDYPAIAVLKGKNNFRCTFAPDLSPAEAPCTLEEGTRCASEYYEQEDAYALADVVVTNYALYLAELLYGRRWIDRRPQLLVCDEGHKLLDFMTEAEAVYLDVELANQLGFKCKPMFKLGEARYWAQQSIKDIEQVTHAHIYARSPKAGRFARLLRQAEGLAGSIGELIPTATGGTFKAVPLWPRDSAAGLLASAKKLLIMSATLWGGDFYAKLMGIPSYLYVGLGPQFDSDRWPVYYRPVAKMNNKSTNADWTAMSTACHEIMHSTEEKGVIHVASYKQVSQIEREIKRCASCRERLVSPRLDESRGETIGRYRDSAGHWLCHPSVGEGESLDDDLCRYQIIAKLRYPDLGDPVVKLRAADKGIGGSYYFNSTAAYTAQTIGRGMRHAEDYCENFIFDGSFAGLYDRNRRAFPEWFQKQLR